MGLVDVSGNRNYWGLWYAPCEKAEHRPTRARRWTEITLREKRYPNFRCLVFPYTVVPDRIYYSSDLSRYVDDQHDSPVYALVCLRRVYRRLYQGSSFARR